MRKILPENYKISQQGTFLFEYFNHVKRRGFDARKGTY